MMDVFSLLPPLAFELAEPMTHCLYTSPPDCTMVSGTGSSVSTRGGRGRGRGRGRKASTSGRTESLTRIKSNATPEKKPRKTSTPKKAIPSTPKKAPEPLPDFEPMISPEALRTLKREEENPTRCIRCGFEAETVDALKEHAKTHIVLRSRSTIFSPKK